MKKLIVTLLVALAFAACDKTPNAPSELRVLRLTHAVVEIEWRDNSNDESYFIIIRNHNQLDRTTRNFYADTTVQPDTDYRYTVRAVNRYGLSDSAPLELRTPAKPQPPAAPDSLIAIRDFTAVTLTWRDNADNESEYMLTIDGDWTFPVSANATNYTHTNLAPNSTHHYVIWARNGFGASDSLMATVTTRGAFAAYWNPALDRTTIAGQIVPNGNAAGYELFITCNDSSWLAYAGQDTFCRFVAPGPFCSTVRAYDHYNNVSQHSEQVCK